MRYFIKMLQPCKPFHIYILYNKQYNLNLKSSYAKTQTQVVVVWDGVRSPEGATLPQNDLVRVTLDLNLGQSQSSM